MSTYDRAKRATTLALFIWLAWFAVFLLSPVLVPTMTYTYIALVSGWIPWVIWVWTLSPIAVATAEAGSREPRQDFVLLLKLSAGVFVLPLLFGCIVGMMARSGNLGGATTIEQGFPGRDPDRLLGAIGPRLGLLYFVGGIVWTCAWLVLGQAALEFLARLVLEA